MRRMGGIGLAAIVGLSVAVRSPGDDNRTGHYVCGVEGLKAATLPPPGLYWRLYNVFYTADELIDPDGRDTRMDLGVTVNAVVNRLIWMSSYTILGGTLGMDALVPVVYTRLEMGGSKLDDQLAVGDACVEPLLIAWHAARADAAVGAGVWLPVGKYDEMEGGRPNASPGKDFGSLMLTVGGTLYLDADRAWSLSVLGRYEIPWKKRNEEVTLGQDVHVEWGIGRTVAQRWDVGVAGYIHRQVTEDRGQDVTWEKGDKDQVMAVGPEVTVFLPPAGLFMSLRSEWEWGAKDRTEGNVTTLTLTKIL